MDIFSAIFHDQALGAIYLLLVIAVLADFAGGVLTAIVGHTFDQKRLTDFLINHVAAVALPIVALATTAAALSAALAAQTNVPATVGLAPAGAWLIAWTGLGAYIVKSVGVLAAKVQNVSTNGTPPPATPAAPQAPQPEVTPAQ